MGCSCNSNKGNGCRGNVNKLIRNRNRLNTFYRTTTDPAFKEEVRLLIIEVEGLISNSTKICPDSNTVQVITNYINTNSGR